MSHIAGQPGAVFALPRMFAGATVRVRSRRPKVLEVVVGGVMLVKQDALFTPLPSNITIVGADGPITASGMFYISVSTFDPMHVVIDDNRGVFA